MVSRLLAPGASRWFWRGLASSAKSTFCCVTAMANELIVTEGLQILGVVSDDELAILYRAARAYILVSHCEGFGLPVVKAMASGCPVVTTRGRSLAGGRRRSADGRCC